MPRKTATTSAELESLKGKAYTAASRALREAHRQEFNEHLAQAYAEVGIEWKPRLSEEEKAAAQLEELLEKYPHLAKKVEPDTALASVIADFAVENAQIAAEVAEDEGAETIDDDVEDFERNDFA